MVTKTKKLLELENDLENVIEDTERIGMKGSPLWMKLKTQEETTRSLVTVWAVRLSYHDHPQYEAREQYIQIIKSLDIDINKLQVSHLKYRIVSMLTRILQPRP